MDFTLKKLFRQIIQTDYLDRLFRQIILYNNEDIYEDNNEDNNKYIYKNYIFIVKLYVK